MNKFLVGSLFLISSSCFAAEPIPSPQQITQGVLGAVSKYAESIACDVGEIRADKGFAMSPYKSMETRDDARYLVLWNGDVGCSGGSGTNVSGVATVKVGMGDAYMVDPEKSSPMVDFSPGIIVERLVSGSKNTMVVEGKDYGPNDPRCCPSIPVQITLKMDAKGNWKPVSKKVLQQRK